MHPSSKPVAPSSWRDLYTVALLESDDAKLSERIAEAEWALVLRTQELSYAAGDHIEEESDLNDAKYSLNALRSVCRGASQAMELISRAA